MSSYLYSLYDTIQILNGQVGIGTNTPNAPFHVEGTVYFDRMINRSSNFDASYSTLSNIQTLRVDSVVPQNGNTISFQGNSIANINSITATTFNVSGVASENMTVNSISTNDVNNNINLNSKNLTNVGTITASNLQVVGEFTTLNTTTSNTEQMVIYNAGTGPALKVTQTGANDIAAFYDGDVPALFIEDGANVGFGLTNPATKLHAQDASTVITTLESTSSAAAQVHMINTTGTTRVGPDASGTVELFTSANSPVVFSTNSTERMRITSVGSVGIGITNPAAPIVLGTNSQERLRILADGNVGIGSTAPVYPVDISGKTRISNALVQTTSGMNVFRYAQGGVSLTNGNGKYIGFTIAWPTTSTDNKNAFRVSLKMHLASDDAISYRTLEMFITPDTAANPILITTSDVVQTTGTGFSTFSQSAAATPGATTPSVDVKVTWNATAATYKANLQIEVFANTALGDLTLTPIHG